MKIEKNAKNFIYITAVFYVCLFSAVSFRHQAPAFADAFRQLFAIPAVNYLLYLVPAVLAAFLYRSSMEKKAAVLFLSVTDFLLLILNFTELYTSANNYNYAIIAICFILFILININAYCAILCLVPIVFMSKLGTPQYIIAANFPLMLMLFTAAVNQTEKAKKRLMQIAALVLLYFSGLYIFLAATGKTSIHTAMPEYVFSVTNQYISLTAAIILAVCVCAAMLILTLRSAKGNGLKSKLPELAACVYIPLLFVTGFMTDILFINYKSNIIFAIILAVMLAMQSCLHSDKLSKARKMPDSMKYALFTASTAIFCLFIF